MKSTIKFLGVGGAFAPLSKGNSSMLITSETGKNLLFDCGSSVQFVLGKDFGLTPSDIDAIYISHVHADHIGSLEWFAFYRYFVPKKGKKGKVIKPKLYAVKEVMHDLWEKSLRGGLESIGGRVVGLTEYFDCIPMKGNESLKSWGNVERWEEFSLEAFKTEHVTNGYLDMPSYGLVINNTNHYGPVYISGDSRFPARTSAERYSQTLVPFYKIFHDCETLEEKSGVHAHYSELNNLDPLIKNKIWLYHYRDPILTVKKDGFAGFVKKGQKFSI